MEILAHQISNHVKRNIEKDITIIVLISNNVRKHKSLMLMRFNLLLYLTEK